MTTSNLLVHLSNEPSTDTRQGSTISGPSPSEDSSIDEQPPKARSSNIQATQRTRSPSVAPIRSLSTRAAPRPPSLASFQSGQDQVQSLESPPLQSTASNSIHASIAKLEFLVHEATRLVENTFWHEQENRIEEEQAPQGKSLESVHQHSDLDSPKKTATKALSGRSSALGSFRTVSPGVNSVTSLPTVKAAVAQPILTLPASKNTEHLPWKPSKAVCADHEARQDDVLAHLHHAACPESGRSSIESFQADQAIEQRPEMTPESPPHKAKDATQPTVVRFAEPSPVPVVEIHPEPSTVVVSRHNSGPQAKESPVFQFIVEDADAQHEADFAGRHEPQRTMTGLKGRAVTIPRKPLRQPTAMLDPLSGVGLKRTSTSRQSSSALRTLSPQPISSFSSPGKGLLQRARTGHERHYSNIFGLPSRHMSMNLSHATGSLEPPKVDLKRKSYVDVYHEGETFNVHDTCHHATIARNWPNPRKRFTATVACINTSCIGLLVGIYAGEVPAIQYAIADFGHYSILGNVFMYIGLAFSTFVFWPLPLLHGRKPYTIAAGLLALVLQVPQGLAVAGYRDPSESAWKWLLLISRAVSGFALGLSDMNLKAILLDCFGASLQSQGDDPLDIYDVRKHGGGMGMWLGLVSWSTVGPISIGFMAGASIVNNGASVSCGFWASLCVLLVVLLLNIIAPEVRRSAFRRTIAEMTGEGGEFSRVTRGEIKMHVDATGPY
ncbi:hypothetical protein PMZ80_002933 [Knufia obscura]|uniref:Uncharacterized protein n=2 Tax=Knufia TaxID=430999 RepID=A0AAN8EET6_9EURO|nr:hypothetical protein PMZ80_002933 [Knufia obscura]KAK5952480.1 hypothetical protein OHC33_006523 [Knufia fluminis]